MRAKIQAVLNRKIRVKITRRKRGRFRVVIPAALAGPADVDPAMNDRGELSETFTRKKDALTWLLVKLRCMEQLAITVYTVDRPNGPMP